MPASAYTEYLSLCDNRPKIDFNNVDESFQTVDDYKDMSKKYDKVVLQGEGIC